MAKTKWAKIKETKGKMWIIKTYYPVYGSPTKYMRKEVSTPTSRNKEGKKEIRYYKSV